MEDLYPHTDKIRELFRHRHIDWLWQRSSIQDDLVFYADLHRLQARIYDLDAYLESHWRLSPTRIRAYWEALDEALTRIEPDPADREALLADIRRYQTQELLVRSGGDVSVVPIGTFYHFKTCDVRLLRELILRRAPSARGLLPAGAWLAFDLLTELEDDLDDQAEDQGTCNVNRYLAAVRTLGADQAALEYRRYADALQEQALRDFPETDFPCREEWEGWMRDARQRLEAYWG